QGEQGFRRPSEKNRGDRARENRTSLKPVTGTAQTFRLMNEVVFVLLGALLAWAAFTGHYYFNPRGMMWLLLAGLLVGYGIVAMLMSAGATLAARGMIIAALVLWTAPKSQVKSR